MIALPDCAAKVTRGCTEPATVSVRALGVTAKYCTAHGKAAAVDFINGDTGDVAYKVL